jgi:glycerol-3-phosphate dehydrogenase subunit C
VRAACDSETCRWQIESSTGVPTVHPITVLAESYRRADAALTEPWHRIV